MKIHLICVGTKMPTWVSEGYKTFAKRLPVECALVLKEIPAEKRGKNADINRLRAKEEVKIIEAVPKGATVIVLDERGEQWSTVQLADKMQAWMESGQDVAMLIGGPEGHSEKIRAMGSLFSLSKLTLPHPLVRVVLAEQVYRAWSVINNHPYHRE